MRAAGDGNREQQVTHARIISGPATRRAAPEAAGDQMGDAQRLGQLAVAGGGRQQRLRLGGLEAGALHEHAAQRLHGAGAT